MELEKLLDLFPYVFRKNAVKWWKENPEKKANSSLFNEDVAKLSTRRKWAEMLNKKENYKLYETLKGVNND